MIKTIFITGISGYIAKACAASLIKKGYAVKGSLRDLKKGVQVKADIEAFWGNRLRLILLNWTYVKMMGGMMP